MRYFESMFKLYEEYLEDMKNMTYSADAKNIKDTAKPGEMYMYSKEDLYYIVRKKIDNLYEAWVVSPFWVLANQNDMIIEFEGDKWAVETWNIVYIPEEVFKKSTYLGDIDEEDFNYLIIDKIPYNKRGLYVPEGNMNFYQNKFHKKESERVMKYKLTMFY